MLSRLLTDAPEGLKGLDLGALSPAERAELLEDIKADLKIRKQADYAAKLGITRNWYSTIINAPDRIEERIVRRAIMVHLENSIPASRQSTVNSRPTDMAPVNSSGDITPSEFRNIYLQGLLSELVLAFVISKLDKTKITEIMADAVQEERHDVMEAVSKALGRIKDKQLRAL